jgi:hypothetical protein
MAVALQRTQFELLRANLGIEGVSLVISTRSVGEVRQALLPLELRPGSTSPTGEGAVHRWRGRAWKRTVDSTKSHETAMGKYFLAWLLGVPGIVLLIIYLIFN